MLLLLTKRLRGGSTAGRFLFLPTLLRASSSAPPSLATLIEPDSRTTLSYGLELIGVLQRVEYLKAGGAQTQEREKKKEEESPNGADQVVLHAQLGPVHKYATRSRPVNGCEDVSLPAGWDKKTMAKKYEHQLELEQRSLYDALEKYKRQVAAAKNRDMLATMPRAKQLLVGWFRPLVMAIKAEQERIVASRQIRDRLAPYFVLLEPEEMAVLTMHVALGKLIRGSSRGEGGRGKVANVAVSISKAIEDQVSLLRLKSEAQKRTRRMNKLKRAISLYGGTIDQNLSVLENMNERRDMEAWELKMAKDAIKLDQKLRVFRNKWTQKSVTRKDVQDASNDDPWPSDIQAQVGAKLVAAFIRVAKIDVDGRKVPAIQHEVVWKKGKAHPLRQGVLVVHPAVIRAVDENSMNPGIALDRALPMVYPPKSWTSCRSGGYYSLASTVMRVRGNTEQLSLLQEADACGGMNNVYKALNVLGNTPWRINKEVLSVVEEVWEKGGGFLDIPPRQNVSSPTPVADKFRLIDRNGAMYATYTGESGIESYVRKSAIRRAIKKNRELLSLRSDFALKLGVAQRFKDEDRMYFPHNMDFRGRAYPIPPHLNHLGADVSRGILQFADALPLGPVGFDWLLTQVANLYGGGADKLPMPERKAFGEKHLDLIIDSAEKPLDGIRWWMNADEPWQLLATCKDIRDALNWGPLERYPSRMHVHQDGSCNGLQHYAALGRDYNGGMAVNLLPADKPQDVYTGIAKIVAKKVDEDAANGHEIALKLKGHVDRKLVKQTVMTSVYGVTFVGAREQIGNRLKERGWDDDTTLFRVSAYAAKVTLEGLQEGFTNAKDIMQWLADCAYEIAKVGKTVVWRTPLGLPVMQPYRKTGVHSVRTVLQQLNLRRHDPSSPVMRQRQKSAFPPNYVHSLDSTHMMMTAIDCHEEGLAFAGVHDSFWTHAGSIDQMNLLLRKNFHKLHSEPLLEQLRDDFERQCPKTAFPKVPELGELDLNEIHNSTYFFS